MSSPTNTAAAPVPYTMKTIFQFKPFRTIWMAQFVSVFGDFLALFGVINLITFGWHGNALQVTAITIAFVLPIAFIGPFAGVFVDHWNVKRVMIASDLIRAFLILLLVFVHSVPQIAVIFVVLSTVSSFFTPAQSVTIRTVVPPEGLFAANQLMAQAFYVVRLASPTIAGALVALLTEKSCFYLDMASFIFSAAMISRLVVNRPPRAQTEKTVKSLTQDFVVGNKFIFTHAGLAFVFIAMAVAMFILSSFSPLLSLYIRDALHAGPFIFGIISAMVGVGMIVGTQVLTKAAKGLAKTTVVLLGLLALGVGVALLGAFRTIPTAAISTFTMGLAIAFVWVPAQTMSQQETPPALVGRVSSTFMSLISFAQIFGLLLSGFLAQRIGVRPLFFSCAGALAVIALVGHLMMRGRSTSGTAAVVPTNTDPQSNAATPHS